MALIQLYENESKYCESAFSNECTVVPMYTLVGLLSSVEREIGQGPRKYQQLACMSEVTFVTLGDNSV